MVEVRTFGHVDSKEVEAEAANLVEEKEMGFPGTRPYPKRTGHSVIDTPMSMGWPSEEWSV
jgi:hypothetical protein